LGQNSLAIHAIFSLELKHSRRFWHVWHCSVLTGPGARVESIGQP
jgi:hypothetical protein